MKPWHAWQQWAARPRSAASDPRIDAPLLDREQVQRLYRHAAAHTLPTAQTREVANSRAGEQRGQRRGSGMDYDDSRPYQRGDEPRHMNWRLSARSGALQMKLFREERRPVACVLLDRRNRMVFGSRQRLKISQAAAAAALTSFTAALQGEQTAALILQSRPHWVAPREGHQAAFELSRQYIAPRSPAFQSTTAEASLEQALALLAERLPDGSQITLISDFADLISASGNALAPRLQALCSRHQVSAIHIADPAEQQLPDTDLRLRRADTAPPRAIDARDPPLRRAFEQASARWFAQREQLLTAAGARYQLQLTSDALTGPTH